MKRLNVVISDESYDILEKLKKENKWNSNDTAIDEIIKSNK